MSVGPPIVPDQALTAHLRAGGDLLLRVRLLQRLHPPLVGAPCVAAVAAAGPGTKARASNPCLASGVSGWVVPLRSHREFCRNRDNLRRIRSGVGGNRPEPGRSWAYFGRFRRISTKFADIRLRSSPSRSIPTRVWPKLAEIRPASVVLGPALVKSDQIRSTSAQVRPIPVRVWPPWAEVAPSSVRLGCPAVHAQEDPFDCGGSRAGLTGRKSGRTWAVRARIWTMPAEVPARSASDLPSRRRGGTGEHRPKPSLELPGGGDFLADGTSGRP